MASTTSADPAIPSKYADYADLFNKKKADALPAHQEWDHKIPLEKEKLPPYRPIYRLTPTEMEAL